MADITDGTPPPPDPAADIISILDEAGYEGLTEVDATNRAHAIAKLMTTKWDKLEAIEHADHLLFPEVLTSRGVDGSWRTQDVLLLVPRGKEIRQARVEARALAKSEKIDEKSDRDLFENLESMCVLARCIRNVKPPHEPWEPFPLELEKRYDKVCLQQMWAKVEQLQEVLNPAPNQLSTPEIVTLIAAIARARHLGPLVVYGPGAQTSLVVSMADLLLNLLGSKLSWESLEHLMQVSSMKTDSAD